MTKAEQREKLVTTRDEACEAWSETYDACPKDDKAWDEAYEAWDEAYSAWDEADKALTKFDEEN